MRDLFAEAISLKHCLLVTSIVYEMLSSLLYVHILNNLCRLVVSCARVNVPALFSNDS